MKKIMLVFGTRPEAIKMCPLVNELKPRDNVQTIVCVTGQHRQMLDQVLEAFHVVPDYDLSIMKEKQTLFDITTNILSRIREVLETVKPDVVLVHGDTSTTFVTALACFYLQIPVGHVEAGLRTYNIYSPYPEEFNRQAVGIVSRYNFAPTELSKQNLLNEGKRPESIYVTGNTAIDALKTTVREDYTHPELSWAEGSRLILITAHRRENLGEPMKNMFRAIRRVMDEHPDVKAIYPIHMNPLVRQTADEILGGEERIHIIEPLEVLDFHNFLARSYLILTDSGPLDMVVYWGQGFWGFLSFSMQMAMIIATGYIVSEAPPIKRALISLCKIPKNGIQGVVFVAIASAILGWISWGLGLVAGAILARSVALNLRKVDFKLYVAVAYTGAITTGLFGISGSEFLLVNTPGALGGVGATTKLAPALTLGCGAVGGSATSDNVTPLHLINIRRVAFGRKELEELRGMSPCGSAPCAAPCKPCEEKAAAGLNRQEIEAITRAILARLGK